MNSSTLNSVASINKQNSSSSSKGGVGSRIQTRPSSLPKGRTAPNPLKTASSTTTGRKPRPSSASVVRGNNNNNTIMINGGVEKKGRPQSATMVKEGPVTRTSFETGSQVKEELMEKAKLSIRNQRLTERYYLTSLQLLKKVNAGACKDNKERKVAMDRLKLMENLHHQSIETTDLTLLASEANLKKMHKNKYPNIQPKIYEASKNYGAGAEKEKEREERESTNQIQSKPEPEVEKPRRTLRGKAASSVIPVTMTSASSHETIPANNSSPHHNSSSSSESSDSENDSTNEKPKTRCLPSSTQSRSTTTPSQENTVIGNDRPKKTLRGGRRQQTESQPIESTISTSSETLGSTTE